MSQTDIETASKTRVFQRRSLCLAGLLFCLASPGILRAVDTDLDRLISELHSEDLLSRTRAEVEIRNLGIEILPELVEKLRAEKPDRDLRLERVFEVKLVRYLDDVEDNVLSLAEEQQEIQRLEQLINKDNVVSLEEIRERIKNLRQRVEEANPKVEKETEALRALVPNALGEILKRMELSSPLLVRFYGELFDDAIDRLGKEGKLILDASTETFQTQRYLLSPLWFWLSEDTRKLEVSARAEADRLLDAHLELSFRDLESTDFRVRERAENEFYLLRGRGLEFLRARAKSHPTVTGRLIKLLDWRIHPRLREKTAMDFNGYAQMDFRQRRKHLIQYARTAGESAIPTLRLVVLDDRREPSIRVKLTAAEQLAGLRDPTGIRILTQRPMPELMKIPEISRDFYILKGMQYKDEKKYDLALREFQKILDDSPFHFDANYWSAFVHLLAKNYEKSIHHFEIARRIRPNDMLTLYNLACAYALGGQEEKAVDAFEASVKAGFTDLEHIGKDPDLEAIRKNKKFLEIIERLRAEES